MSGPAFRLFLLVLLIAGSLGAAGVGMVPAQAADERDGRPGEWEEQVAADARGDVLISWPGTVDLFYLTAGEVFSVTLGEPFLFLRVGYNITEPGDEDVVVPEDPVPFPPGFPVRDIPDITPDEALTTINVTFNISQERSVRISLYSLDLGETWLSNEGLMVSGVEDVRGHKEVIYIAPLRRFELTSGDLLSDYNVSAYRAARATDTMQGFEPLNDYLPAYFRVHPLVDRALTGEPLPIPVPVPLPPPPQPPVPIPEPPVPIPDYRDHVPDEPWPYPPGTGEDGIPYGVPTKEQIEDWDPTSSDDRDRRPPPVEPDRLGEDQSGSRAWNTTHKITDGTERLVARSDQQIYTASFNHVAWANFTVESLFDETDQRVLLLLAGISGSRWDWRYGLDMPLGVKELPAGGSTRMSFIGVPASLFAAAQVPATAIFISDWGGIDVAPVTFFNTNQQQEDPRLLEESELPRGLVVDILNEDDPFRVNDVRKVMVRVRSTTGAYVTGFESVRAYIYPAGTTPPQQPYQLDEKAWMDGVYEIDFVFNRPGAWVIDVFFFDYPATRTGDYPSIDFVVRVDHEGKTDPIIPLPAALGSLGLMMLAVAARERMSKAR